MIWIHIAVMAVVPAAYLGGKMKWIPYEKFMEEKDFHKILLVIFLGNLLGLCLTWQNNRKLILKEGTFFIRPEPGEGNQIKQFVVKAGEEELVVSISIPEQEGEEEEAAELVMGEEETLQEAIIRELKALNEEKQEKDKYYLPSEVDGMHIQWSYPADHSGMMILSLSMLVGILLVMLKEQKRMQEEKLRKEQMMQDYPNLVTKLCLLLRAGMTIRRAFEKTAIDYRKNHRNEKEPRYAYEEMLITCYEMERGVSEQQAYEGFGRRCGQVQYRTLATLLTQNLKRGSQKIFDSLERESVTAFEDRKRQARIQGEAAATKLLLPMVLMLLVVLVILMVPACMSFYA